MPYSGSEEELTTDEPSANEVETTPATEHEWFADTMEQSFPVSESTFHSVWARLVNTYGEENL